MVQEKQNSFKKVNALAIFSYLGILVIIPFLTAKEDEFVQYHVKQGLILLILGVIGMFIGSIPIIGWILAPFITLFWLVLVIIGIMNVLKNKKKELPVIGNYAHKLNL